VLQVTMYKYMIYDQYSTNMHHARPRCGKFKSASLNASHWGAP